MTSPPDLREVLRWLLGITRPVHRPLLMSTVCRVFTLSLDLALFATAAGTVIHLAQGEEGPTKLLVLLAVLALARAGFFYLEQFSGHYVAFKALELLRTHVFAALWPKAPAVVSHSRSGDILASLTRDVDRIEVVYAHTFAPVVSAYVVGPVAVIGAGFVVGWAPVSIAAACLAISLFVVPFLGMRRAMSATRLTLAQRRDLAHHITDSVFGGEEVVGYGREPERLEEMDAKGHDIALSACIPRYLAGMRRGANVCLSLLATLSVPWIASRGTVEVSAVTMAALCAGALRLFEGPRGVEDAVGYLDHSLAAARRLWDISHTPERVHDGARELVLTHAPVIRFEGVTYSYPRDDGAVRDVLTGVSLEVPAGGHAVLVGHSGSGKSTLVQLLLRYDDPREGAITLDGEPITRYTLDSLRRHVVAVSQRNQLLDCSLAENLRLGAPDATDEEIWDVLDIVGLADEVRAMPEGLLTQVGQNGSALSGGQLQRACLARALLMDPRVLILDEFAASLNTELEDHIRASIDAWPRAMTIVEISHRPEATGHADLVATVDAGQVIEAVRKVPGDAVEA